MPDHFHLIITPEERIPLEKAVQYIKGGYATAARRELGLSEVWQPKPTNHRIRDAADYEKHRDYIFDNPVRAGLTPYPEDFPFSSAKRRENLDPRPPALKRWIVSDALTPAIKAGASTQKRGSSVPHKTKPRANQLFPPATLCWDLGIDNTSSTYLACTSPAITAATLSSIWFQPSS
jgi:hypothetical protein